ncbi:hypothetical protein [uncultured Lamprocystis sp.]|uniref:hypothetical protein n=1 Tax=uncultured Lamprocystis sp. TaxID=543132 RepID=UPI0025E293EF|nr:hypothetical protein [uncultured Lamprocystis sp.]
MPTSWKKKKNMSQRLWFRAFLGCRSQKWLGMSGSPLIALLYFFRWGEADHNLAPNSAMVQCDEKCAVAAMPGAWPGVLGHDVDVMGKGPVAT